MKTEILPANSEQFATEESIIEIAAKPWYTALCEEIEATRVETTFIAADTLLQGKLAIGDLIKEKVTSENVPVTALVKSISRDTKGSERDLWFCYKFAEKIEFIRQLPAYNSKSVSWNKVKKMLADPEKAKKECAHLHTVMVCVCEDCGAKVENSDDNA